MADQLPQFNAGDKLTADSLNALVQAIQDLQDQVEGGIGSSSQQVSDANEPTVDPYTQVFPAHANSNGTWQEQTVIGGSLANFTDGRSCSNTSDPSKAIILASNQTIMLEVRDDPDYYYVQFPTQNLLLRPCNVSQTGGQAGNATIACNFTYSFSDLSNNSLGSNATPIWSRPALGKLTAATHGTYYTDSNGTPVLYQVDEVYADVKRSC